MKTKIIIVCALIVSCLTSYSHAGKSSSAIGGAAIGAIAGIMLGSAMANGNQCHSHTHTNHVYTQPVCNNGWYTERVETCRPVVETRRVYTQPVRERVVTRYERPVQRYTEVYRNEPVYQTTEYCSSYGY